MTKPTHRKVRDVWGTRIVWGTRHLTLYAFHSGRTGQKPELATERDELQTGSIMR
ncbi:MAG: hypothetical protein WAK13_00965 [Terriglobales bacterium]